MKRERALVLALTLAALALRVAGAAHMAFWDDDVGTLGQAARIDSVGTLLAATHDWHPPLSFVFMKAWLHLAGLAGRSGEELACRAPFLLLGALAVPLAWLVARKLLAGPREAALLVALLVAVDPLLVWSDRDLRGYALLVPLVLAAALFWLRARETGGRRDWAAFVALGALACWDHYNAIPLVAALLALSFLEGRRRAALLAGLGVLVLFSPWLPALREHLTTIDFDRHLKNVQLAIPPVPLTAPCYVLFGLVLGYTVFPWHLLVVIPVALSCAALAVRGAWLAARTPSERSAAVLGLLLPVFEAATTSFKMPRYFVASVPFLAIVLVRGMERTRRGAALFLVLLAGMLFSDLELLRGREHHFLFPLHPWREAEARVRARPAPVIAGASPFAWVYAPDLAVSIAAVPTGSRACWLVVDERTSEEQESSLRAALEARGLHALEGEVLLVDPDAEERERWVHRGTRREVVKLVRFER